MRRISDSVDLAPMLAQAVEFHQAGDLLSAQAIYTKILAESPQHFDALHLLGVLRHQQGENEEARALMTSAIAVNPQSVDALCNLGIVFQDLGRNAEALEAYDRALAIDNRIPAAHNNRGTALRALDRPAAAIMSFDRAIAIRPDYVEARFNRAALLAALGRYDEAVTSYEQLIVIEPDNFEAHRGHARALMAHQEPEAALMSYARAVSLRPDDIEVRFDRGILLNQLGRFREALGELDRVLASDPDNSAALAQRGVALAELERYEEAEQCLARAVSLRPGDAAALDNHGVALQGLGRPAEALICHDRALAIAPDNAAAVYNRGHALVALGRHAEALDSYGRALALAPADVRTLLNRGIALNAMGRYDDALTYLDAAIGRAPGNAAAHLQRGAALMATDDFAGALASYEQTLVLGTPLTEILDRLALCVAKLCDWARTAEITRQLEIHIRDGSAIISPLTLLHYESTPSLQLACARHYARARLGSSSSSRAVSARKHDRLRIAYLSANFNRPALASLVAGLFESHDRITFDIHGISFGPDEDAAERTRVVRSCDAFHDLHASSDRQIAERLRELEIDIAVDLTGHGRGGRPGILASRPVPIQVNYLGYPGTMGADFFDYIIADSLVLPPGEGAFYSEKIVRLPGCYQVNDAGMIAEATPSRADAGLPDSGFVYASFNGGIISEPIFDAWMSVLAEVEGSVLWLSEVGDATKFNLRQHAQARGIDPGRLIFAPRVGHAEHLARLRLADLFLDTLPCGARAAAGDALWDEVPVVTCRGKTFASRVAVSLLHGLGLDLLVASHLREYTALARLLAQRPDMLAGIRKRLAEKRLMSPLFDSDRLRRDLEEAYKIMWARYEAGDPPWSFDIDASPKIAVLPPPPPPAPPPANAAAGTNGDRPAESGGSDPAPSPPPAAPAVPGPSE
jgi:predicted O-linked N-acetylglucosamine transferase (SPINDLY family)